MKAAGSLQADLSLARKKSDPAAEIKSDKAAGSSESDKAADESGRFAPHPSGLVAGSEDLFYHPSQLIDNVSCFNVIFINIFIQRVHLFQSFFVLS